MSLVAHTAAGSPDTNAVTTSAIDTTGGHLIVLSVANGNATDTPTDNKGNTYTLATGTTFSGDTGQLWYNLNAVTGTGHTWTYGSAGSFPSICAAVFSETGSALDQTNNNVGLDVSSLQPGSITPTQSGETIVTGVAHSATSGTNSINQSFTISDTSLQTNGANNGVAEAYLEQGAAAAVNPTWTGLGGVYLIATIASFKITAAVTTPPLIAKPSRSRLLTTRAHTEIGRPPPPTIPAPRGARPKDITRAKFDLPPPRLLVGRPPPAPMGPPRSATPQQIGRAKFLLPRPELLVGRPPPPTLPAPRPAFGLVTRAKFDLPRADFLRGAFPQLVVVPRSAKGVVGRARFLLPRAMLVRGITPPAPLAPPRPAQGLVYRARIGRQPGAMFYVALVPRGPGTTPVVVSVLVIGQTPPREGAPMHIGPKGVWLG